jgi:hypothetical protein
MDRSCDEALKWAQEQLSRAGLRSMRTFDLHTARHALDDCPCPHHGTEACDCQMVVLLVYGKGDEPATLILHGNDGQTRLSLAENPNQRPDAKTIAAIRQALEVNPIQISQKET